MEIHIHKFSVCDKFALLKGIVRGEKLQPEEEVPEGTEFLMCSDGEFMPMKLTQYRLIVETVGPRIRDWMVIGLKAYSRQSKVGNL